MKISHEFGVNYSAYLFFNTTKMFPFLKVTAFAKLKYNFTQILFSTTYEMHEGAIDFVTLAGRPVFRPNPAQWVLVGLFSKCSGSFGPGFETNN